MGRGEGRAWVRICGKQMWIIWPQLPHTLPSICVNTCHRFSTPTLSVASSLLISEGRRVLTFGFHVTSSLCYNNPCWCSCCIAYQSLLAWYSETGVYYPELWGTKMMITLDYTNNPWGGVPFTDSRPLLHIRRSDPDPHFIYCCTGIPGSAPSFTPQAPTIFRDYGFE